MNIEAVISYLEQLAPPIYQTSYDNCGLLVGDKKKRVSGILCALDITPLLLEEAVSRNCNLVVVHHPLIFQPLKELASDNNTTRCLLYAIRHDLAIYAIHTNIDQMADGVNKAIGEALDLTSLQILEPIQSGFTLLTTFVPHIAVEKVKQGLYQVGAKPSSIESSRVSSHENNKQREPHQRLDVAVPNHLEQPILNALRTLHPLDEPTYYLHPLSNSNPDIGMGMVGLLPEPLAPLAFLDFVKKRLNPHAIRHSAMPEQPIHKVALCGGAGGGLLKRAIAQKADALITADVRYHTFFEVPKNLILVDVGHYESEVITKDLIQKRLQEHLGSVLVLACDTVTNPVHYY